MVLTKGCRPTRPPLSKAKCEDVDGTNYGVRTRADNFDVGITEFVLHKPTNKKKPPHKSEAFSTLLKAIQTSTLWSHFQNNTLSQSSRCCRKSDRGGDGWLGCCYLECCEQLSLWNGYCRW